MPLIMGYWRKVSSRCQKCHQSVKKGYEIRESSVTNLPKKLQKLVPIGLFCPYCARGIVQALSDEVESEVTKEVDEVSIG